MKWVNCDRKHICTDNVPKDEWRINYDSENSYHNWVDPDKLDLTCVDKNVIGLLGSAYFLGFAISSGITPNLADKYGRKTVFVPTVWVNILCFIIPMVLPAKHDLVYVIIGMQFINGFRCGGMMPIGYSYMLESLPLRS